MSDTMVYLVGDKNSPKSNSWLAMCQREEDANKLMETLEGACTTKAVKVEPRRHKKSYSKKVTSA